MDKDYQTYKDFDMTGAKRGIPPQILHLQQQDTDILKLFDKDVLDLLIKHNNAHDHKRINGVLRSMLA